METINAAGVFQSAHEGYNKVMDTLYVTPSSQDWKRTNEQLAGDSKAKQEQIKFNVVNNKGNQKYIIEQEGYMEKLRAQYPDEKKYPDARLEAMAEEQAKAKLKSLADTYAPYGIQDGKVMYELDKDRKKYGLTADEAIQQRSSFEKFNTNKKNIVKVNIENKPNISSVSEVEPHAKDYYYNGYTKADDMAVVRVIEEKLKVSPNYAMAVDQTLRKKGGRVNYKGNDPQMKDVVDQINKYYRQ